MIRLKENNLNWFVLESDFYAMGLSMDDMLDIQRLIREKLTQIKNRKLEY